MKQQLSEIDMTNCELELLKNLLLKLEKTKPELTVLVTEADADEVHNLVHESKTFYCELTTQIDCCLDDEENTNLR